jgi:hypothetical protein
LAPKGEALVAAAWLHDVGYAPDVVDTGFHPLDGARYLAVRGVPERVVNLVARHSYAILEADLRGVGRWLATFPDEGGVLRDALWYCDLTTSPDGKPVGAEERIAEIKARYGPGDIVTRFITEGEPELLAAVERTERRLGGGESELEPPLAMFALPSSCGAASSVPFRSPRRLGFARPATRTQPGHDRRSRKPDQGLPR